MKTRNSKTASRKVRKAKIESGDTKAARTRECGAIFAVLSEFVDGMLSARDCRKLRRHLNGCKPCVRYLDSLKKTVRLCRAYQTASTPPLPPAVRKALVKALSKRP